MRPIHVETPIAASVGEVWRRTQDPVAHARWDARFQRIAYIPGTSPQRFRYRAAGISGLGVTAGERDHRDGGAMSALTFTSDHPWSPIRSGSGYWRYRPVDDGMVFLTGYDYRPGWPRAVDVLVRPVLGWLTAWSFDRLRLWLETGASPERSRNQALAELVVRAGAVLAASTMGWPIAVAVVILAALVPPLPGTPAARRCRRSSRPGGRTTSSASGEQVAAA